MERVEYTTNGNRIGISIKDPNGASCKWSEQHINLCCSECGSTTISTDKSAEAMTITCHECANHWYGTVTDVLSWYHTERARAGVALIPFDTIENNE